MSAQIWIDYTGKDSLWTVAITGTAVYVGGHERWLNNSLGHDDAAPGAVARPGIAAMSPVNGLPFTWNPGRQPRGAGCLALLATPTGLWIGSDTDYIGDRQYFRQKVAFFPLAGGAAVPAEVTPRLPGRVFLAGATAPGAADPNRFAYREFNGATAGGEMPVSTGISWGSLHGAFTVGGQVIYGKSDGNLYERSFDGSSFGSEVELDPYDNPTWDNIQTGSGQTYQGVRPNFSAEIPSVTSMFFTAGRLYYTLAGQAKMHWRWFEPESGVVGSDEFTVPGATSWSKVAGAFLSRSTLYYADTTTGDLRSMAWSASGPTGSSRLVNDSTDWASRGLFALADSTNPTPSPVASISSAHCVAAVCRFTATPWTDPDAGVVRYAWRFGDGTAAPLSKSTTVSHRYTTEGAHRVTLTVTTTSGASSSASQGVTIVAPIEKIRFVGASKSAASGRLTHVVVTRRAKAGDAMVLFDSVASTKTTVTPPKGWKLVRRTRWRSLTTAVYAKVATARDAGRPVSVRYSRAVHSSLILAVYANTSSRPIESAAAVVGSRSRAHRAPALRHLSAGTWVVGYWTQTARATTSWLSPRALKKRANAHSGPRPADGAIIADLGKACKGTCRLGTARSTLMSSSAVQWAIALRPALR